MNVKFFLLLVLLCCGQACTPQAEVAGSQRLVKKGTVELVYQQARMLTETPLELQVHTPNGWQLQKATLIGLSMDMPIMPLFFNQAVGTSKQTTSWQTQFLLGACADDQMTWQLELLFKDEAGTEQRLLDEFVVFRR